MSDNTRTAPPPYDRQDPNRPDTGPAEPVAGPAAWDDPFVNSGPSDVSSPAAMPMRPRPPLTEVPRVRQPAPPPPLAPRRRPPAAPVRSDALGWVSAALVYSGAALLGASIYQGKRTSAAEAGHPPIGRFIEADGTTFHYVDIGEGAPIVLLHGIGSTLDDWFVSGVLDRLLPHHRIIAIDRPGYGYSKRPRGVNWTPERQARAMARMLHRLGAHEATVVAHSFGVLPALALALQHPTFARNLVLIGGVYMPGSSLGRLSKAVPSVPLLGPLARGTVSPAIARAAIPSMVRTMFEPQPVTRAFREHFSIDFATRPSQLRAATDDLGAIDRAAKRFLPHYGELDIPVTVVTGSGDAIFDPDTQSRPFAAALPNASLVVIPAGGHLVHHTSPDLVSEVILETAAGRIQPSDLGPPPDARAGLLDPHPAPESSVADGSEESPEPTRQRAKPENEPDMAESAGTADEATPSRARPATSFAEIPERSHAAEDDDGQDSSASAAADISRDAPSPVGPASSPSAAHFAGGEPAEADDGDESGDDAGESEGAEEEAREPAPKRRRTRSRRKPD